MFERLFYASVVFTNNMKHIHLHAVGNKFDRIHSIAQEYYNKAAEESDLFAEWALEFKETIQNPSNAATISGLYVENENEYYWESAIAAINNEINTYITELAKVRDSRSISDDVASELDTIIRYWKKENNYKNAARMKEI